MAEVLGIVTGVIGILPICSNGFAMIGDVVSASETAQLAANRIRSQKERFDEWIKIWDLPNRTKFQSYAQRQPDSARRVMNQLVMFYEALFDAEKLKKEYGLKPKGDSKAQPLELVKIEHLTKLPEADVQSWVKRVGSQSKSQISFIKRCKFVWKKDDGRFERLIGLLKEYNETLLIYGPSEDLMMMARGLFNLLQQFQGQDLISRAEAYREEARIQGKTNSGRQDMLYRDLGLAAEFKAVVSHYKTRTEVSSFDVTAFNINPSWWVEGSASSTMALIFNYPRSKERRVVLIEWMGGELNDELVKRTKAKATMLNTPKPGQLLLPSCYGVVKDRGRIGLILVPPDHIRRNLPSPMQPGAISIRRRPVSLEQLLLRRQLSDDFMDIGMRFRLAKKLVDAVHLMHCVGWVHKNIRPSSIFFFPSQSKNGLGPAEGNPPPIDYGKPIFVGFGHARVDDIVTDPGNYYGDEDEPKSRRPGDITLDLYQHPDKRSNPELRYSRAFDIYSLGCVLLEIGLWKPLSSLIKSDLDIKESTQEIRQRYKKRLEGCAGSKYAGVVDRCLNINMLGRTANNEQATLSFCSEISVVLEKCVAWWESRT